MPILDVDKAHTVMSHQAWHEPRLRRHRTTRMYYLDRTLMLFGDAKQFVGESCASWAEDIDARWLLGHESRTYSGKTYAKPPYNIDCSFITGILRRCSIPTPTQPDAHCPPAFRLARASLAISQSFSVAVTGSHDASLDSAIQSFVDQLSRQTGIPFRPKSGAAPTLQIHADHGLQSVQKLGERRVLRTDRRRFRSEAQRRQPR